MQDELKGLAKLVEDVIEFKPGDFWEDFKTIQYNRVCGGATILSLTTANGVEEHFNDCNTPAHEIEPEVLAELSLYFKSDLTHVRIHEGCSHVNGTRDAITFGENIYFQPGKYTPKTPEGLSLLAHELTHVLQYRQKGFGDFLCEYAAACSFDRYGRNAKNLCTIEKDAYHFQDLVLEDQRWDGDGVFQRVDNCPRRFNPGQEDLNKNHVGDICEVPTYFGDVDGDGKADAIAVERDSIFVEPSNGQGFASSGFQGAYYLKGNGFYGQKGDTGFADVNGDGKADAIAVYEDGVWVHLATGGFSRAENWTHGAFYGSKDTFFADVDGDGKADAIAVNYDKIWVRLSTGKEFSAATHGNWTAGPFYGDRGTYIADVNGDGKADAIAVNYDKIWVRKSNSGGFDPAKNWTAYAVFGTKGTYFADVTGENKADAILVEDDAIWVRPSNGASFGVRLNWSNHAENGKPLRVGQQHLYFADVNGDGLDDAIGSWYPNVDVWLSTGTEYLAASSNTNYYFTSTWHGTNCLPPSPAQVVIYQDPNLRGKCRVLDVGEYPHSDSFAPVGNDAISSVEVGANVKVTLYQDGGYGGKQLQLDSGQSYPDLDKLSFNGTSAMKVVLK